MDSASLLALGGWDVGAESLVRRFGLWIRQLTVSLDTLPTKDAFAVGDRVQQGSLHYTLEHCNL